jgi:hypothetical protein
MTHISISPKQAHNIVIACGGFVAEVDDSLKSLSNSEINASPSSDLFGPGCRYSGLLDMILPEKPAFFLG